MPNFHDLADDLERAARELEQLLTVEFPQYMATQAERLVMASFDNEQYMGAPGSPKWAPRAKKDKGKGRRHLLVDTGFLRRSIEVGNVGPIVYIRTSAEYAQIHNEGGEIQMKERKEDFIRPRVSEGKTKGRFKTMREHKEGKGFSFKAYIIVMPRRQFMPIPGEPFPYLFHLNDVFLNTRLLEIFSRQRAA